METQEHILKQCAEFKHITENTTYETYFDDNTNMTKKQQKPYTMWETNSAKLTKLQ